MAKANVPDPSEAEKRRRHADELLREFENLPAEVRRALSAHSATPDVIEHIAGGVQRTLDDLQGERSAAALKHAATLMRAQVGHASRVLLDLQALAGRLDGLAWASEALESALHHAEQGST